MDQSSVEHTREQRRDQTLWYHRALYEAFVDPSSPQDPRRDRITREMAALLYAMDRA